MQKKIYFFTCVKETLFCEKYDHKYRMSEMYYSLKNMLKKPDI